MVVFGVVMSQAAQAVIQEQVIIPMASLVTTGAVMVVAMPLVTAVPLEVGGHQAEGEAEVTPTVS